MKVEAWGLPGVDFTKKNFNVEFDELQYELADTPLTTGTVTVPKADVTKLIDSGANYSTLLRVFEGGVNTQSFFARQKRNEYGEEGPVSVVGPSIHIALEDGVLFPQDQVDGVDPNTPSTDPDYEFRNEDIIGNPGAENTSDNIAWVGGGFEEGLSADDAWSPASGSDWNGVGTYGVSSAFARTGTYSLGVNPGVGPSGIGRTVACRPNTVVSITAYLRAPDNGIFPGGGRIGIGAQIEEGGGTIGLNQYWIDDVIVAEVSNAVKGTGNAANPALWYATSMKFLTGPSQHEFTFFFLSLDDDNLQPIYIDDITISGPGVGIEPWWSWLGVNFTVQSSVVHSGAKAFQFQVYDPTITQWTQGVLQTLNAGANVGRTFTFGVWVRSSVARNVTILAKRGSGTWMFSKGATLVPGTWTLLETSGIVDEELFYVEIRDAETGYPATAPGPVIYFDDAYGYWGLGEQTGGAILQNFFDQVKARGVLTWLKTDGFSATVDSNGVAYSDTESLVFWHGMNLLQVMDVFKGLGYEWDIVWNDAESTYEFEFYVPGTMGGDQTASGFKAHPPTLGDGPSDVLEQDPGYNTFLLEGETGTFQEWENGSLAAAYGRREKYLSFENAIGGWALLGVGLNQAIKAERRKFGLTAALPVDFVPMQTIRPGSLVKVHFAGEAPELQLRVARIIVTMGKDGVVTKRMNFGEHDYREAIGGTTSSATSRALNDLLRKYKKREEPSIGLGGEGGEKGGQFTVQVAAYNASTIAKTKADIVCTSPSDNTTDFTNAKLLGAMGSGTESYNIVLSEGDFYLEDGVFFLAWGQQLQGMGPDVTRIHNTVDSCGDGGILPLITLETQANVRDLSFYTQQFLGYVIDCQYGRVNNVYHQGEALTGIHYEGAFGSQDNIQLDGAYRDEGAAIHVDGLGGFTLNGIRSFRSHSGGQSSWGGPFMLIDGVTNPITMSDVDVQYANTGDGIVVNGIAELLTSNVHITTNMISPSVVPHRALVLNNCGFGQFSNMSLTAIGGYGISSTDVSPSVTAVFSNIVIPQSLRGIDHNGLAFSVFDNVHIYQPKQHGVRLSNAFANKFSDFYIFRPGSATNDAYDGFQLETACDDNDLLGVRVEPPFSGNKPRWAINIANANCDRNSYLACRSGPAARYGLNAGATATPYRDAGTGTINVFPGAAAPQGDNLL